MKKIGLRLLFLATIAIIGVLSAGCASKPNAMVKSLIDALKKGDFDKAQQYMIMEENGLDFETIKKSQASTELYNKIFANLQYEILDTSSNNNCKY
jgi:hypothetical protein